MTRPHIISAVIFVLILAMLAALFTNLNKWLALRQLTFARQALTDHDLAKAVSSTKEAARLDPYNAEAYFIMARAYRRQGKGDRFRGALEQAAGMGTTLDRIRREQWLAQAQAGQLKESVPHMSELLINPGDDGPEICEAFANGFFLMYRLNEAFAILDAWEKDYPRDAQPHVFRAAVSSNAENWTAAAKHLRAAIELAPNRTDVRIELAKTFLNLQQVDEAAELLEYLRRTQPSHPEVLATWAQVLIERGRPQEACLALDQVLQIDAKHVLAMRILGEIRSSTGQVTEAIKLLEEAVAIKGSDRHVRYALGTALKKAGREDEARQHFEFVAKSTEVNTRIEQLVAKVCADNGDVDSRFEIAQLLQETGQQRERLLWLRSIVAIVPDHYAAHIELAKYYADAGDSEESMKHKMLSEAH